MLKGYFEDPETGVISQQYMFNDIPMPDYGKQYIDNSYQKYGAKVDNLSYLRLGFLLANIPEPNKCNLLDYGYGNGSFLKAASKVFPQTYGFDINLFQIPEKPDNVKILKSPTLVMDNTFDVVTFFDSLEHVPAADKLISLLKAQYIMVSVPSCNYPHSDEWFAKWKHRRPNEHLYHFNKHSLIMFMQKKGYSCISGISNFEDTIRVSDTNKPNIITGVFKNANRIKNV